jgi:hypothetical protein
MRVRINWAFRDGSHWIRGHDVIKTDKADFNEDDAEDMMDAEMECKTSINKSKMVKFRQNACADSPQTWKVLSIKKVGGIQKEVSL